MASVSTAPEPRRDTSSRVRTRTGPEPLSDLLAQTELAGVLVDNCEYLLDACAALTGRLLAAAIDLRVLATGREPLGLAGKQVWPVRPLDTPDESLRDATNWPQWSRSSAARPCPSRPARPGGGRRRCGLGRAPLPHARRG